MHMWLCCAFELRARLLALIARLTQSLSAYAVLGVGILVALMILVLYLQRLIFHHIPPSQCHPS
jgi:hypothetical protein